MARDLNVCSFVGRLGKDPEPSKTKNGVSKATFSIANNRDYRDKATGEWVENASWIPMVAFGSVADIVNEKCKRGNLVSIQCVFNEDTWQDDKG